MKKKESRIKISTTHTGKNYKNNLIQKILKIGPWLVLITVIQRIKVS